MTARTLSLPLMQIVALGLYVGVFFLLVIYPQGLSLLRLVLFGLGLYIGMGLLWFDENYGHRYYRDEVDTPSQESPQDVESLYGQQQPSQQAQQQQVEQPATLPSQLITRSLLFVGALIPLGFFLISSTGSSLGVGMFLGICVSLSLEMAYYLRNPQLFDQRFLTQLRRQITEQERKILVSVFVAATVLFSLLLFL